MEELNLLEIETQAKKLTEELITKAQAEVGDILVVGCSSSEIIGGVIGTSSSVEAAGAVFRGIYSAVQEHGLFLAAQCCEHLNRALILEKEVAKQHQWEIVSVVPQPKAGGSFATAAWEHFQAPVAVEHMKAQLGIDIGDTLIGMHLADVAVPVRLSGNTIGNAHVVCARTRPKYIGGERAKYSK